MGDPSRGRDGDGCHLQQRNAEALKAYLHTLRLQFRNACDCGKRGIQRRRAGAPPGRTVLALQSRTFSYLHWMATEVKLGSGVAHSSVALSLL